MNQRPDKINWVACSCGSPSCKRQHPTNLGMFYQGCGFEPEEVKWLDEAWNAGAELAAMRKRALKAEDDASRLRYPDTTGH